MKRLLLLFSVLNLFWLLPNNSFGSHVSGGEITYENIGGDTFLINLTLYRDCAGIPLGNANRSVRISSSCTTPTLLSLALQNIGGTEVSQICPTQIGLSTCSGGALPGMQAYFYQGQIVLGTNCADYLIQYQIPNRNVSVNVQNSNTQTFYVDATLNSVLYPNNSSPQYTAPPIPYVCINQTVNYNYGVVENDGDSLVYSLVSARSSNTSWVVSNMTYNTGYSAAAPITGVTINSGTGELNFTPTTPLGNYIVVAQVQEYNGAGQLVGTVQRDIQFVVMNCANQIPQNPTAISNFSSTTGTASVTDSLEITANVGDQFCFDVVFNDTNVLDTLTVVTNATSALPGSIVTITGTNPVTANICWTVPPGMNTNNTVTFQASDSACPVSGVNSLAVQIVVPQPPSLFGSLITTPISCNGICDGTAQVVPSGGVGPYSFYWYPNPNNSWCCQFSDSIYDMCAGTYILIITDLGDPDPSTNTWDTIFDIIDAPPIAIIPPILTHDNCDTNSCGGSITVFAFGGNPPRNFLWSTGSTNNSISGLCEGVYTLTVTDANGCSETESYTIYEPTPFNLVLDSVDSVSCFGANDGAAFATASPTCGISPNGCGTSTSVQLGTGTSSNTGSTFPAPYGNSFFGARHQILFTAAELTAAGILPGPISSLAFDVGTLGTAITYTDFAIKVGCTSASDLTGGWETGLYEVMAPKIHNVTTGWNTHDFDVAYIWDGSSNMVVEVCFNNSTFVTNGNSSTNYTATPNQSVRYFHANNDSVCSNNGLSGTSPNRPNVRFGNCASTFTYSWSPAPAAGQTTPVAINLTAQSYTLTATSNEGCTESVVALVEGPSEIIPTVTLTNPISCAGACDAAISVTSTGGAGQYTYAWSNSLPADSTQLGLCIGTYYFTITDAIGCTKEDSIIISNPPPVLSGFVVDSPISCNGVCDGVVVVSPSGGNGGPYVITWPTGLVISGDTASGLCGNTDYIITVSDVSGCTILDTINISEPTIVDVTITQTQQITCGGICDAELVATPSGGTPGYLFNWSNGAVTPTISNLCIGLYSVTITDANGCTDTASFNVAQPPALSATLSNVGTIDCFGDTNVNILSTVTGGIPPYTYAWSNGDTTADLISIGAGAYILTVTDSGGCTFIVNTDVTQPDQLLATVTVNNPVICGGLCDGSATVNVSGGSPGFTISWPGGLTGATQINLCAGTYVVTVTDSNSCSVTTSFTLLDPPPLTITDSIISNVKCFGECNGEAVVNATGGLGPITYTWPGGKTGATQDSLCAGVYTVTVSDSIGCTGTIDVTIVQPLDLLSSINQSGVIVCAGDSGINLTAVSSGGTAPYQYFWTNGGPNGDTWNNLPAGVYTVVVIDSNLCLSQATITVVDPPVLVASVTINNDILCEGDSTGDITAIGTGGVMPYSYLWDTGDTTASLIGLGTGTYLVTITDSSGCSDTTSVTLNDPLPMQLNQTVVNPVVCFGACDGAVTFAPTGGTGPITINWPTGVTVVNDTAYGLCPSVVYPITFTDSVGCQVLSFIQLTDPNPLDAEITLIDSILCGGDCSAEIALSISGGTAPYTYAWSGGLTGTNIDSLCAGTYSVTVTDSNMCQDIDFIIITEPDPLVVSISTNDTLLCNSDTNVVITSIVSGGVTPYSYTWSTTDTTDSISGVGFGTYVLTVVDSVGCSMSDTIVISAPPAMVFDSIVVTNSTCNASDGGAQAYVSGGTPGYTYQWTGNLTTNPIVNVPSGIYSLTVTDTNGCVINTNVSISDIGAPVISFFNTGVNCLGECLGTSTATISGTGPFSYLWSNGDTTNMLDSLCAGPVTLTVVDSANGCVAIDSTTIFQDTLLTLSVDSIDNSFCDSICNGQAMVTVTGLFSSLSYTWSNGDTTSTIDSLCGGVYTVTVVDSLGCSGVDSITINDMPPLAMSIDSVYDAGCANATDGAIDILVTGGTPGYTFSWTGPNGFTDTTQNVSNLAVGQYFVTVTDTLGCMVMDSAIVIGGDSLRVNVNDTSICDNFPSVNLNATVTGANGTISYFWADSSGDTISTGNPISIPTPADTSIYTIVVLDGQCFATDTFTINILAAPDVDAGPAQTVIVGDAVKLGGSPTTTWGGSTFLWTPNYNLNNNLIANPTATPEVTTTYMVEVFNLLGCGSFDTVTITAINDLEIFSGFTPNGDGDNDTWNLPMLEKYPNVNVDVYNRWGEQLFHSEGYDVPWDGKYKNEDLPVGTYYYVIDVKDGDFPEPFSGPLTIMR